MSSKTNKKKNSVNFDEFDEFLANIEVILPEFDISSAKRVLSEKYLQLLGIGDKQA